MLIIYNCSNFTICDRQVDNDLPSYHSEDHVLWPHVCADRLNPLLKWIYKTLIWRGGEGRLHSMNEGKYYIGHSSLHKMREFTQVQGLLTWTNCPQARKVESYLVNLRPVVFFFKMFQLLQADMLTSA